MSELACDECGYVVPVTTNEYPDVKGSDCSECGEGRFTRETEGTNIGEECCEKSENESDEFHPSMKRLAEKLEFQGATVSKTIRSKDEDTAGDSTAEQRETVADAEPTESAAASDIPIYGWFNEDPLVRLSDVRERLRERIEDRDFEDYFGDRAHLRVALEHELERIIEEEFTQKGGTE